MPNLQSVLRQEIQRLARKEIRSELEATKKEYGCPAPSGDRRAETKKQGSGTDGQLPGVSRDEKTEGRAFESGASKGHEIFGSVTEGSAEEVGVVPGGLRAPRRRQQDDDIQLGERKDQTGRETLGDIGIPQRDRKAGGTEAPGFVGRIERRGRRRDPAAFLALDFIARLAVLVPC